MVTPLQPLPKLPLSERGSFVLSGFVDRPELNTRYNRHSTFQLNGFSVLFTSKNKIVLYWQDCGRWAITPCIDTDSGEDVLAALENGAQRGVACQSANPGEELVWMEYGAEGWVNRNIEFRPINLGATSQAVPSQAATVKTESRDASGPPPSESQAASGPQPSSSSQPSKVKQEQGPTSAPTEAQSDWREQRPLDKQDNDRRTGDEQRDRNQQGARRSSSYSDNSGRGGTDQDGGSWDKSRNSSWHDNADNGGGSSWQDKRDASYTSQWNNGTQESQAAPRPAPNTPPRRDAPQRDLPIKQEPGPTSSPNLLDMAPEEDHAAVGAAAAEAFLRDITGLLDAASSSSSFPAPAPAPSVAKASSSSSFPAPAPAPSVAKAPQPSQPKKSSTPAFGDIFAASDSEDEGHSRQKAPSSLRAPAPSTSTVPEAASTPVSEKAAASPAKNSNAGAADPPRIRRNLICHSADTVVWRPPTDTLDETAERSAPPSAPDTVSKPDTSAPNALLAPSEAPTPTANPALAHQEEGPNADGSVGTSDASALVSAGSNAPQTSESTLALVSTESSNTPAAAPPAASSTQSSDKTAAARNIPADKTASAWTLPPQSSDKAASAWTLPPQSSDKTDKTASTSDASWWSGKDGKGGWSEGQEWSEAHGGWAEGSWGEAPGKKRVRRRRLSHEDKDIHEVGATKRTVQPALPALMNAKLETTDDTPASSSAVAEPPVAPLALANQSQAEKPVTPPPGVPPPPPPPPRRNKSTAPSTPGGPPPKSAQPGSRMQVKTKLSVPQADQSLSKLPPAKVPETRRRKSHHEQAFQQNAATNYPRAGPSASRRGFSRTFRAVKQEVTKQEDGQPKPPPVRKSNKAPLSKHYAPTKAKAMFAQSSALPKAKSAPFSQRKGPFDAFFNQRSPPSPRFEQLHYRGLPDVPAVPPDPRRCTRSDMSQLSQGRRSRSRSHTRPGHDESRRQSHPPLSDHRQQSRNRWGALERPPLEPPRRLSFARPREDSRARNYSSGPREDFAPGHSPERSGSPHPDNSPRDRSRPRSEVRSQHSRSRARSEVRSNHSFDRGRSRARSEARSQRSPCRGRSQSEHRHRDDPPRRHSRERSPSRNQDDFAGSRSRSRGEGRPAGNDLWSRSTARSGSPSRRPAVDMPPVARTQDDYYKVQSGGARLVASAVVQAPWHQDGSAGGDTGGKGGGKRNSGKSDRGAGKGKRSGQARGGIQIRTADLAQHGKGGQLGKDGQGGRRSRSPRRDNAGGNAPSRSRSRSNKPVARIDLRQAPKNS